jgi:FkbM family methyltransferase
MPAPGRVHQRHHRDTAARMGAAWVGRWLAHRAQRFHAEGLPQLAVFGFEHVGRSITVWGRYERDELELLLQALRDEGLLPRTGPHLGLVLDIGANIGNHALFFAPHAREVWAFEPNPRTGALLALNAALAANVRVFPFGLSDEAGSATLHVPADNIGMATLQPGAQGQAVACTLQRLDEVPGLAQERVVLVKIDVEGHEAAALRGGLQMLRRERPVVVFEQLASELRADGGSATLDVLREAGYRRFWTLAHTPAGRSRVGNLLSRLLFGETLKFVPCEALAPGFHSMVVALPEPASQA